ncbi:PREDICTED: uncharacterized protein LOC105150407 [Acromyrmex echinatior]|uniref:uncharacterized protein LOC105150407 n=1 Tax=Acromyrmex echinatior TaxID=103372 RepID=UPI000580DAC7|nr:PREDICTED: uncharacterized protein LOC105150407 [Acromyrmex echinatior]
MCNSDAPAQLIDPGRATGAGASAQLGGGLSGTGGGGQPTRARHPALPHPDDSNICGGGVRSGRVGTHRCSGVLLPSSTNEEGIRGRPGFSGGAHHDAPQGQYWWVGTSTPTRWSGVPHPPTPGVTAPYCGRGTT